MKTRIITLFTGILLVFGSRVFATNVGVDFVDASGGKAVSRNVDDDDDNEEWDKDQGTMDVEDDDLKQFKVTTSIPNGTLSITVEEGSSRIKVWADRKKEKEHGMSWTVANDKIQATATAPASEDGKEGHFYIEGLENSESWDDVKVKATISSEEDTVEFSVVEVDLDVDSGNENGLDADGFTADADKIETSDEEENPGKFVVFCSGANSDWDQVADMADGFNIESEDDASEYIDVANSARFTPIRVYIPKPLEPMDTKVKFIYDPMSKPEISLDEGQSLVGTGNLAVTGSSGYPYECIVRKGGMRLWRKNASERTSGNDVPAGDFLPSGVELNWTDIAANPDDRFATLYLEYLDREPPRALGPEAAGQHDISVTAMQDGMETSDTVKIRLLPIHPGASEIYLFSGHSNDNVKLSVSGVQNLDLEWRLATPDSTIGLFSNSGASECDFIASSPGDDQLELVIAGKVAWNAVVSVIEIKSRTSWGAVAADVSKLSAIDNNGDPYFPSTVTFHHSSNFNSGPAEIQRIQKLHMGLFPYNLPFSGGRDYGDIGYHYIVDKDGSIYQGRDPEGSPGVADGPYTLGSHVENNNTEAGIGICLLGNYEGAEVLSDSRQKSLEKALTAACRRFEVQAKWISYHKNRYVSNPTECPGSHIIEKRTDILQHVLLNLK